MIYLIKGKGRVRGEYVGVCDDPEEQEHALWLEKGFKAAPEDWSPPESPPEAASDEPEAEASDESEVEPPDYSSMGKPELKALAESRGLEVEGSGSGGGVLRDDLIWALEEADEE